MNVRVHITIPDTNGKAEVVPMDVETMSDSGRLSLMRSSERPSMPPCTSVLS